MSIESMRVGGGRCPPLLVGGLLVICLMLIVNWYSLSTENLELLRQLDELGEQLKISAEERDQCMTLRANLEQRSKKSDEEVASLHVRIAQQFEIKRQKENVEMSLTACKAEVSSLNDFDKSRVATIEALRLDKETKSTELNQTKDENKKLHEELDKLKNELEAAKSAINAPQEKKVVEIVPKAVAPGRKLDNGQLGPVPKLAVQVSQPGLQGMKFHGIPILPQDPPGAERKTPRFSQSVTMLHGNTDNPSLLIQETQANTKVENNVDGGGQNSQEEVDEMKKQISHMMSAHNLFEDTDDIELNNVGDEEKEQKLVTNDQDKQKSPAV